MTDQDLASQMQQMVANTQAAVMMQQNISALDGFAVAAMSALLRNDEWTGIDEAVAQQIAHDAWLIADAMVAERRKRLEKDEPPPVL